jgi:CRP-like cAMP-binding protein
VTQLELENALSKAKILRALTYPALRRIAAQGRVLRVQQGHIIIGPELGPTSVYVVLEGLVEVIMPWGPVLNHLGPGELFGEISLVEGIERSAYCKAEIDSLIFEIPFHSFHADMVSNSVVRAGLQEIALARQRIQTAIRRGALRGKKDLTEELRETDEAAVDGASGGDGAAGSGEPAGAMREASGAFSGHQSPTA